MELARMRHEAFAPQHVINSSRRRPLLIASVIVLLLAGALSVAFGTALGLASFRDFGYPDSATLLRVQEFIQSGHIYPAIDRPPYLVTLYGPVFYVLLAIPYKLAQATSVQPQSLVRLGILGAFCLDIFLVFLLARWLYNSRQMAGLSALFAVSLLPLASWTTQIRCDFVGLFFALLSIYLFLLTSGRPQSAGAALCAGIGLLVKQTFLAAPVAIVGWLIYKRRYREAAFWGSGVALTVAGGYALSCWREPLMLKHLAAIRHPIFEFREALTTIGLAVSQAAIPFFVVAGLLVLWKGPPERLLLLIYGVSAWLVAILTVPQAGGAINYFSEPLLASSVLAGPGLCELQRKIRLTPLAVTAMLCVLLLGWFLPLLHEDVGYLRESYAAVRTYHTRRQNWKSFVSVVSGRTLLSTFPDVTLLSATPEIPDPYLNNALELRGQWNSAPVVAQIDGRHFDLIVVGPNDKIGWRGLRTWDDAMWGALKTRYRFACVFDNMEVWLPRQGSGDILPRLSAIGCEPPGTAYPQDDPSAKN
jgi:hypothetical protein